jgi:hypothetical protein
MKNKLILEFNEFVAQKNGVNEAEVTLPWEGDPNNAVKEYGVKIKKKKYDRIDGFWDATFVGTRSQLLKLMDEFGGEETIIAMFDPPYGRIKESVKSRINEAEVILQYDGDPNDAAKKYGLKIKKHRRGYGNSWNTTFVGTRSQLLKLMDDEFGGQDGVIAMSDAPFGRIKESVKSRINEGDSFVDIVDNDGGDVSTELRLFKSQLAAIGDPSGKKVQFIGDGSDIDIEDVFEPSGSQTMVKGSEMWTDPSNQASVELGLYRKLPGGPAKAAMVISAGGEQWLYAGPASSLK